MQALDTNLLVRLLVDDDAAQAAKVDQLLEEGAQTDSAFWIADIVLVELAWTLERKYQHSRSEIAAAMQALADNATLQLESAAAAREAVALYRRGPADFVDCLLAAKASAAGCTSVRTFDKKMRGLSGVKLL